MGFPLNVTDSPRSGKGTTGFSIPARNSKGLDHTIGVRCWPEFALAVNKIIAKRAFNYRTAADLYLGDGVRRQLDREQLFLAVHAGGDDAATGSPLELESLEICLHLGLHINECTGGGQ